MLLQSLLWIAWLMQGAAKPEQVEITRVQVQALSADVDVNGKMYVADDALNLLMYGNAGDTQKIFSISNYGTDPLVDASNPLEPVVFFTSTGKCIWFDNQLNTGAETDMFRAGIIRPLALGRSNDGNIWAYDHNSRTLKKADRSGNVLQESVVLQEYEAGVSAGRVFDNGNHAALCDHNGRIYIFDRNLVFLRTLDSRGRLVGISDKSCYVWKDKWLMDFPLDGGNPTTLFQWESEGEVLRYLHEYILSSDGHSVFLHRREP